MSEHLWMRENLAEYVAGCLDAEERERAERHLATCAECTAAMAKWQKMDQKIDRLFADERPRPGLEDRLIQSLRTVRRRSVWLSIAAGFALPFFLGLLGYGLNKVASDGNLSLPGNGSLDRLFSWNAKPSAAPEQKDAPQKESRKPTVKSNEDATLPGSNAPISADVGAASPAPTDDKPGIDPGVGAGKVFLGQSNLFGNPSSGSLRPNEDEASIKDRDQFDKQLAADNVKVLNGVGASDVVAATIKQKQAEAVAKSDMERKQFAAATFDKLVGKPQFKNLETQFSQGLVHGSTLHGGNYTADDSLTINSDRSPDFAKKQLDLHDDYKTVLEESRLKMLENELKSNKARFDSLQSELQETHNMRETGGGKDKEIAKRPEPMPPVPTSSMPPMGMSGSPMAGGMPGMNGMMPGGMMPGGGGGASAPDSPSMMGGTGYGPYGAYGGLVAGGRQPNAQPPQIQFAPVIVSPQMTWNTPPPTVTSISPSTSGSSVTITGTNLTSSSGVTFADGSAAFKAPTEVPSPLAPPTPEPARDADKIRMVTNEKSDKAEMVDGRGHKEKESRASKPQIGPGGTSYYSEGVTSGIEYRYDSPPPVLKPSDQKSDAKRVLTKNEPKVSVPAGKVAPQGGWGIRSPWADGKEVMERPATESKPGDTKLAQAGQPKDGPLTPNKSAPPADPKKTPPADPNTGGTPEDSKVSKTADPPELPKNDGRKIIRTGEMEFEVESFDNAVGNVARLMNEIRGGFVSTINSEKLPNGKVRGSIIVRMPPEHLDKFVYDLRRELTKAGELKGQRISALDITKQFTDIESELRAARAMEERLINIIKTGKGEVKDLLAAERELGTWRTKIEKMEGELRYYGNQVALSTLTITIYEKEILSPASFVINETVRMNIMTEDVEKAQKATLTAVTDLKGRVAKSDLKQQPDGQLSAKIILSVPFDKADEMRARLAKLGDVASQDSQRAQGKEAGGLKVEDVSPTLDVKARFNNVQFDVELYNLSHIKARETFNIDVAARDVAGAYSRLRTAILKYEGQNVIGMLNEQDRLNVNAKLEFSIFTLFQADFDKLLGEQGDVIARSTAQVPPSEAATNRKVGYSLTLSSLDNIAPRETLTLKIATKDPAADYRKLRNDIAKIEGQIRTHNLNEQDIFNISANLDFSVPATARVEFDKLLAGLGDTVGHGTTQIPNNQPATERKVGYNLTILSLDNIAPRETIVLRIVARDPSIGYRKLQEEVAKAQGKVRSHFLNDTDPYNVSASLEFSVPIDKQNAKRAEFDKLLAELGDTVTRNTTLIPVNQTASDRKVGYSLTLDSLDKIQAKETFSVTIAGTDVAASFHKLRDSVLKNKGRVFAEDLKESDKLNVSASLQIAVFSESRAEFEKLLADQGDVIVRTTTRAPINSPATERRFVYLLTLENLDKIQVKEGFAVTVAGPDVADAFNKLRAAVVKGKGRIYSEQLKEHEKPFVSASLEFKIFKEQRKEIEDLLAESGEIVDRTAFPTTANQITTDRKIGYTLKFENLDKIQAKESFTVTVAGPDVVASYKKLYAAVVKGKGRIFAEQLKEHEKPFATASLEFKIFKEQRKEIEDLLADSGEIVDRTAFPTTANQITTDRKIGYSLKFESLDKIPAKESFFMTIAGPDVIGSFHKLRDSVVKNKGRIFTEDLKESDKLNASATLYFSIFAENRDEFEKLLAEQGDAVSRISTRAQANQPATERKFIYSLSLENLDKVPVKESFTLTVAGPDVAAAYKKLHEAIAKGKGRIFSETIEGHEKPFMIANLEFKIFKEQRKEIEDLLAESGEIVHRATSAAPANPAVPVIQGTTDRKIGYTLKLVNLDSIQPREINILNVAGTDVKAAYLKMRDAVKDDGWIFSERLKEHEKPFPSACLAFKIFARDREKVENLLLELGEIVKRTNEPVEAKVITTDRKICYVVWFESLDGILPREVFNLKIAGPDVEKMYADLMNVVEPKAVDPKAVRKGRILNESTHIDKQDNLNVTATLDFNIYKEHREEFTNLLKKAGETIASSTLPLPANQSVTDRMIGYRLSLYNINNIPPRETIIAEVTTRNLSDSYTKLRNAVVKAEGQVRSGEPKEQEKTWPIEFVVPVESSKNLANLLNDVGQVTSRRALPVKPNDPATELKVGFSVRLHLDSTSPREKVKAKIACQDIDASYLKLKEKIESGRGKILNYNKNKGTDSLRSESTLEFDVPASQVENIDKLLVDLGYPVFRGISKVAVKETEATTNQYLRYDLTLVNYYAMPRETWRLTVEVADVPAAVTLLRDFARDNHGAIIAAPSKLENGIESADIQALIPLATRNDLSRRIRELQGAKIKEFGSENDPLAPDSSSPQAVASFYIVLTSSTPLVSPEESLGAQIRNSLYLIFRVMTFCLVCILLGLGVLVPWGLVIWAAFKIIRKVRSKPRTVA